MAPGANMSQLPAREQTLPGRSTPMPVPTQHFVSGHRIVPPFPQAMQLAQFGAGCFWGVERKFWQLRGVYSTAAGYAAGFTPNPTYEEVCSGLTGHAEVVRVVFDPAQIEYTDLLRTFWEMHDPTQGMRQGNDRGTQYRSGIYTYGEQQMREALASRDIYAANLRQAGRGAITTEVLAAPEFYYAEDYHQQYLAKNPGGYCPDHSCGVRFKSAELAAGEKA